MQHLLLNDLIIHASNKFKRNVFIEDIDKSFTFEETINAASYYCNVIRDEIKEYGDNVKIVIKAEQELEFIPIFLGVILAGCAAIPFNPSLPEDGIEYYTKETGAYFLIKKDGETYFLQNGNKKVYFSKIETAKNVLSTRLSNYIKPKQTSDDIAMIIFTSGSTGLPKGVVSFHRHVTFVLASLHAALDYLESDKIFIGIPFSFDYGLYQVFLCLMFGSSLFISKSGGTGLTLFKELVQSNATVLPAVGPMFDNLEYFCKKNPSSLNKLRLITNTGAHIPEKTIQSIRSRLENINIQLMYGLTECKRVSISPPNADLIKPNTCGLPLPLTEVYILDDNDNEAPVGEIGQIVIKGSHIMAGYWKDDTQTNSKFRRFNSTETKLYTGDYGKKDKDGYLFWIGRKDDIYKQNGFRVSASEIEESALSLDTISLAVVLPYGFRDKSTLFYKGDASVENVKEFLYSKIERHKLPFKIIKVADFKLTHNGKIDKKWLLNLTNEME